MIISSHIFYNVIRYRLLSHVTFGKLKQKYKDKYRSLNEILKHSRKKKFYFLGVPLLSLKHLDAHRSYALGGLPFLTISLYVDRSIFQLFGIEIFRAREYPPRYFSAAVSAPVSSAPVSSISATSPVRPDSTVPAVCKSIPLTEQEQKIFDILQAMQKK